MCPLISPISVRKTRLNLHKGLQPVSNFKFGNKKSISVVTLKIKAANENIPTKNIRHS